MIKKLWNAIKDCLFGELCDKHNERDSGYFGCSSCYSERSREVTKRRLQRERQERVQEFADGILLAEQIKSTK